MAKDYEKLFEVNSTTLKIHFPHIEAANLFKSWLCEMGEQDFWEWEEVNKTYDGSIKFNYHDPGGSNIGAEEQEDV